MIKKHNKKTIKIKNIIIMLIISAIIVFLGYLAYRYLIPRVEHRIEEQNKEKIKEISDVTENTYKSNELEIRIDKKEQGEGKDKVTYYVADIKLKNPERITRAFANNEIGANIVEKMNTLCERNNAILAINGDYYSFRKDGIVIGNSHIYRNIPIRESLAMYKDGTMEIFNETSINAEELIKKGCRNTLSFGPVLVRNGIAEADYTEYAVDGDNMIRGNIATENPRTGIGYYDKNHYCFVVVDGRQEGYSKGVTLREFALIFENLGCSLAYNLDGGNSANMYFRGNKVNKSSQPGDGEREISDIVYIY